MSEYLQEFLDLFYRVDENGDPDLVATFLCVFGLVFVTYLVLECFFLLRSATNSLK